MTRPPPRIILPPRGSAIVAQAHGGRVLVTGLGDSRALTPEQADELGRHLRELAAEVVAADPGPGPCP